MVTFMYAVLMFAKRRLMLNATVRPNSLPYMALPMKANNTPACPRGRSIVSQLHSHACTTPNIAIPIVNNDNGATWIIRTYILSSIFF